MQGQVVTTVVTVSVMKGLLLIITLVACLCYDISEEEFERRHTLVQDENFWVWLEGTDNATHFKSKDNLNFWSKRPQNHSE